MEKLISLSEYIEFQEKLIPYENSGTVAQCDRMFVWRVIGYQRFIKQPLTLGMFVPLRQDGKVLLEPTPKTTNYESYPYDLRDYNEALSKVLFKGFKKLEKEPFKGNVILNEGSYVIQHEWNHINVFNFKNGNLEFQIVDYTKEDLPREKIKTIEDLSKYFNIKLTPYALKQIGINQ